MGAVSGQPKAPVSSRPVVTGAWVLSIAAALVVGFGIFAAVLPRSAALGDQVQWTDRASMFGLGVFIALVVAVPSWPRVRADADGVRTRGFVGGYRSVPWQIVKAVEFPERSRWALLELGGDETVALYAIQRADGQRSVDAMDGLRALLRASRSDDRSR